MQTIVTESQYIFWSFTNCLYIWLGSSIAIMVSLSFLKNKVFLFIFFSIFGFSAPWIYIPLSMDKSSEIMISEYEDIESTISSMNGRAREIYCHYKNIYLEDGWVSREEYQALDDIYKALIDNPRHQAQLDNIKEQLMNID